MSKNLLIIDKKSFLSLIIIFMLIFSAMAPTVLAMEIAEQNYESENPITNNKVIDFSKITSGGVLESDGYNIKKNGSNYTIKFKNLTASKVILPKDDNDIALQKYFNKYGDYTEEFYKDLFKGTHIDYSRKTHITIELEGTNKINGYGLVGGWLKGVTIKGSGSLEIITHKEDGKAVAGISLETDEIKDNDENTGLVIDGTTVTVTNPYSWGINCNGDMKLKGTSKVEVKSIEKENKSEDVGDIKTNRLYQDEKSSLKASNKILVVKDSELTYELNNKIEGEILDFSDTKTYNFKNQTSYASSYLNKEHGSYSISKNKNNYTIILDNLVTKKIILPHDDADLENLNSGDYPNVKKEKARKTHITLELKGNSKITGYGIEGFYIKGLTIKGKENSSLEIITHLENKSKTDYIVPGISIETDEIDDIDKNKGFVLDNAHVTVTNPYYWGIICNGDMELTNKSTLKVKSFDGIKKRAEAGDISTDKLFVGKDSTLENSGKVLISKLDKQVEQENKRELEYYKQIDQENPKIEAKIDGKDITTENKIYCENPIITVTDDTKISCITINGETIRNFTKKTDTERIFEIPLNVDCNKEIVATDVTGKKTTLKFSSNSGHILHEEILDHKDPTCMESGYSKVKYTCLICKQEIKVEEIEKAALGHKLGSAVIQGNSSIRKCTRCEYTEETNIPTPVVPKAVQKKSQLTITQEPEAQKNQDFEQEDDAKLNTNNSTSSSSTNTNVKANTSSSTSTNVKANTNSSSSSSTNMTADKKTSSTKQLQSGKITASNFTKTASTKSQSFNINAKKVGDGKLTYKSDNKSVTVNSSGKVTIKAKFVGKATITITSGKTKNYNSATKKITITVKPSKVTLSKVTNTKGKKLTIKWNKNTTCSSYQIQISTDKNFKKNVKTINISKNNTVSKVVSKLTKNKRYYVRIRGCKKVSNVKYYSNWSSIKNTIIKK